VTFQTRLINGDCGVNGIISKIGAFFNADILYEGHFGVFKGKKKVEKFIESYMTE